MLIRLQRNIYFHSKETGLISKKVYKEYNWDVVPILGATVDDSAWHRNDVTKIEEINIPVEGDMYYVELNPMETESADGVEKVVEVVKAHGWKSHG